MKRIVVVLPLLILGVFLCVQQSRPDTDAKVLANFIVVDSTGKAIGPVVGVGETHPTVVAVPFRGRSLPVTVFRTSFLKNDLYFTTDNCTGQPFQDESNSPFPVSAVSGPGNMLYAASGPGQSITAASILVSSGDCFPAGFPLPDAAPIEPVLNLNMFTPPFKIVTRD